MKMMTACNIVYLRALLLLALLVSGCAGTATSTPLQPGKTVARTAYPSTLTVLAAASLVEPFEEIGQAFEAQPENTGMAVEFSFAGSQQLARQIGQGAPADVFAAANQQ